MEHARKAEVALRKFHNSTYAVLVHDTEDTETYVKKNREHHNRLMQMIGWIEDKYPEYVDAGGIVNITVEQYANPCFFQHKCLKDLV
jgi:hypothetical protein